VNGTTRRGFPATAESLPRVREFLRACAAASGLSEETADDLLLAVSEACANAVLHSGSEDFEVEWRDSTRAIEVEVRDRGTFRRRVRVASVDGPGGFGIPLMTALADRVEISEGTPADPGTRVRLTKRRSGVDAMRGPQE
jgi:anti-sigma regulatory factor (Ser/Thr protein kinase)